MPADRFGYSPGTFRADPLFIKTIFKNIPSQDAGGVLSQKNINTN
jgi:hypothetical protein